MATMVSRAQPLPLPWLQALVRRFYGIDGTIAPLTGERDQNVRLTTASGVSYVLKIAHPDEPDAESELAPAALLHVHRSDPGLPCQRVVSTLPGEALLRFTDALGAPRRACLVGFLPGIPLAATARSRGQREACGRMGGRLTRALTGFEHPGANRALIWDVRQLHRVPALLEQVPEFPAAAQARRMLGALIPRVAAALPAPRRQVVHNDLNALNILVDPRDATCITGVIDFGDAVHTVLVSDAAVTAAEHIPESCCEASAAAICVGEVLRPYEAIIPMTAVERTLLGPLIASRLITSLILQQWHRRHNPAGGHYAELEPAFIRLRLDLAQSLMDQHINR